MVWREFVNITSSWSMTAIIIRLLFSIVIGVVIGVDRTIKRRGAGIKTHSLVCLGSTIVMLTGQYVYFHFPGNMDMCRLGAQVVSGVGFLGVGTIIVTGKNQVRGLTTAAGLWACACLGLAIGVGFVEGTIIALILIIIIFRMLTKLDETVHKYAKVFDVYAEFDSNKEIALFIDEMRKEGIKINSFEIGKAKIEGEGPNAIINMTVPDKTKRYNFIQLIREMECIRFAEEL